jgi:magnesium chelatase family protein
LENCESKPALRLCGQRLQRGRKKATSRTPDGKMPHESRSSPREIQNYLGRISGPLLDRIDLHVEVPPVKFREIAGDRTGETSAQIRERVVAARKRQQSRFAHKRKITCNALMGPKELKEFCELDEGTKELLKNAMADLNLSARACDRILKLARTIADLAGSEKNPERPHFGSHSIPFPRPAVVDVNGEKVGN